MRTIEAVLDEMIGANYMVTQSQIKEIREIHAAEHVPDTNDGDMISRQTATNGLYRLSLGETDAIRLYYRMHDYLKKLPPAENVDYIPIRKDDALQAGKEGREINFYIGGRLFAIREKAQ